MTTAYTSLLGLALPVTGELSGTWGDTVNNSITSLLDSAIAGTTTLSTDADVTLTTTTGAANTAREAILLCSGARTTVKTITAPAQSKIYTIINATTGGFAVKIVGVGPTTGLTIPNGSSAVVAWNGSDFIEVGSSTVGNFTVNGNLTVTGTSALNGITTLGAALVGPASATVFNTVSTTVNAFGAATTLNIGAATGTLTVANTTLAAKAITASTTLTVTGAGSIEGLTVGRGAGAVATNTAVGASALAANTSGSNNSAFGTQSLQVNTTGAENSAFGLYSLLGNTTGSNNSAFGRGALQANTTGANNVAVGYAALQANTTASNNTAVGYQAGYTNTTGTDIVSMGYQALFSNTTGATNNAFGKGALQANTTASYNNAFGTQALLANTTGAANCSFGHQSLLSNTTGSTNMAFGGTDLATGAALQNNTTGTSNNAFGAGSLKANTTGNYNTGVGHQSLNSNTTASGNTAVGHQSSLSTTFGSGNASLGYISLQSNTTGSFNTAMGYSALQASTTASSNSAFGYSALTTNTTGANNTAVGYQAGNLVTGAGNQLFGYSAGSAITTGAKNVIIGSYTGSAAPISATGSNYIVLSDGDGNVRQTIDSSGNVGIGATSIPSNTKLLVSGGRTNLVANSDVFALGVGYASVGAYYLGANSANDSLIFSNSVGSEKVRIDSSGNVGIGTASPTYKLDVTGQGRATTGFAVSTDGSTFTPSGLNAIPNYGLGYITSTSQTVLSGFGGIPFYTNQVERMRIDSSGNVGIGTSSPSYKLDINTGVAGVVQRWNTNSVSMLAEADHSGNGNWFLSPQGTATFNVKTGGSTRLTIDSSGNVGIGTSTVTSGMRLDVQAASSAMQVKSTTGTNVAYAQYNNTGGNFFVGIDSSTGGGLTANSSAYSGVISHSGAYPLSFGTSNTERMRIDSSGNVGIGTSSPASKLNVAGTFTITGAGMQLDNGQGIQAKNASGTYRQIAVMDGSNNLVLGGTVDSGIIFQTGGGNVRGTFDSSGNLQVQTGAVMPYAPAPTGIAAATTLTNANIQGQIISATGTTYTITMPLGTTLETLATWATTNISYDFFVINTASGTVTMAVNTGVTSLGTLTIATGVSAHFRIRRTAANTFVLYRLS